MSISILVAYATRYGSTQEVAEAVMAGLREHGLELDFELLSLVQMERPVACHRATCEIGLPSMPRPSDYQASAGSVH